MATRLNLPSARTALLLGNSSLAAVAIVVSVSGCSTRPVGSPAPSASISATHSASSEDAAPLAAYRGMWGAYVEAAKTSDAEAPELRTYATGDALKRIVGALIAAHSDGKVILGALGLDPHVTMLTPKDGPSAATI